MNQSQSTMERIRFAPEDDTTINAAWALRRLSFESVRHIHDVRRLWQQFDQLPYHGIKHSIWASHKNRNQHHDETAEQNQ